MYFTKFIIFPQKEGGLPCTTHPPPPPVRSPRKNICRCNDRRSCYNANLYFAQKQLRTKLSSCTIIVLLSYFSFTLKMFAGKEFQMFEQAAPQVHLKMSIVSTQFTAYITKRKLPFCKSNNAFIYLFCFNICHIYFLLLMCLLSTCAFLFNNIMCAILT